MDGMIDGLVAAIRVEGRIARQEGLLVTDNPYNRYASQAAAVAWRAGWLEQYREENQPCESSP